MKIGCLLSVREKAKRLPNKVMLDINGKPLTYQLINRLRLAKSVDTIILSTSVHKDDQVLVQVAKEAKIPWFCGHEEDKLDRYYHTALKFGLDAMVIVDGDDLFCFPEGIDWVCAELKTNKYGFVNLRGLPLGAASTGITVTALKKVLDIKDSINTEVWGGYFLNSNCCEIKTINIDDPLLNHENVRLTMDYEEDYLFTKEISKYFSSEFNFSSYELMDLLINKHPELVKINQVAQQKYMVHLEKSTEVKFKEGVIL